MPNRKIYDSELHAHFVTFSCFHRRRPLDHDQAKQIVLTRLAAELETHTGTCVGYVLMPDHVHAIVWFPATNRLSAFMKQWKQRSSAEIKKLLRTFLTQYAETIDAADPIWQRKYYSFNLYSAEKTRQKLTYMHANPVRAGLAKRANDWPWSSARYYEFQEQGCVPVRWIE